MSPTSSIGTASTEPMTADTLFSRDELEALLRCDEDLDSDQDAAARRGPPSPAMSTEEYDAFLADDAEELFAAFYETLDLPLTMSPLFPEDMHMPEPPAPQQPPTAAPPRLSAPTMVKTLEFSSMSTYSLAVAAGMARSAALAHWDSGTLSFHFVDALVSKDWAVPVRVPDFLLGPDWMPYVVAGEQTPRFDLAFGTSPRTVLDFAARTFITAPINVYLALFFRMTGKCVSLVPLPKIALSSTEHGPCVPPFTLAREMLPHMFQHGFYVARVVVSFDHLQQAGALPLAPLPSCVATPAFEIAPHALPKGDRDTVRGVVRQTAMLVAAHVCRFAPTVIPTTGRIPC